MPKENKRDLDTVEELKKRMAQDAEKIRRLKRIDSELNLQEVSDKINSDQIEDIEKVVKACYDYIAQHRALLKQKDTFTPLE